MLPKRDESRNYFPMRFSLTWFGTLEMWSHHCLQKLGPNHTVRRTWVDWKTPHRWPQRTTRYPSKATDNNCTRRFSNTQSRKELPSNTYISWITRWLKDATFLWVRINPTSCHQWTLENRDCYAWILGGICRVRKEVTTTTLVKSWVGPTQEASNWNPYLIRH